MKKIYYLELNKKVVYVEANSILEIKKILPKLSYSRIIRLNVTSPLYSVISSNRDNYFSLSELKTEINETN